MKVHKPNYSKVEVQPFFDLQNAPFDLYENAVYSCYLGSVAYGTSTETSDTDVRGVVMPPPEYYFGLKRFEQAEDKATDTVYYGLEKFVRLAYKGNPHQLEMLYVKPEHQILVSPLGEKLLANRHIFLSKFLRGTLLGYAYQQLVQIFKKKTNGTGRQHLIQEYGYDTKMAMHAVRLFNMGLQLCREGYFDTYRPEAAYLLEIRNGKYKLEDLAQMEEQEVLDEDKGVYKMQWVLTGGRCKDLVDELEEAFAKSNLPEEPDYNLVNSLLQELTKEGLALT